MFEISHFEKYDTCMSYLLEEVDRVFIARKAPYHIAMSGGSVLAILPAILRRIDEDISLEVYLVDERFVPHDHLDSNTGALAPILSRYSHVTFHPVPICPTVSESLAAYEEMIAGVHFDLIVLGAGPDGHTASLFPHTDSLDDTRAVLHTTTERFAVHDRLTLSFATIARSSHIWMYFRGEAKYPLYEAFLQKDSDYHEYPALKLREYKQAKVWYVREDL